MLAAAVLAEAAAIAILAAILWRIRTRWVERGLATALGITGLVWFAMRLRG